MPDLPGCYSTGDSMDQARDCVQEAIDLHLLGMMEDGEPMPVASTVAQHKDNPDYANGVWALVSIDVGALRSKKCENKHHLTEKSYSTY